MTPRINICGSTAWYKYQYYNLQRKSADPSPEPLGPRSQVQFGCEITGTLGGKLIHWRQRKRAGCDGRGMDWSSQLYLFWWSAQLFLFPLFPGVLVLCVCVCVLPFQLVRFAIHKTAVQKWQVVVVLRALQSTHGWTAPQTIFQSINGISEREVAVNYGENT